MSKNPFKVGDRVYVYPQGWGVVASMFGKDNGTVEVEQVKACGEVVKSYWDYNVVSFTEYDPINGGLSHERHHEGKYTTNPVWSPIQEMTLDAIVEKLQKHDRYIKEIGGDVAVLKNPSIDGQSLKSAIDAANRRERGRICSPTDLKKDVDFHKEYCGIVSAIIDTHDITGFSIYNETAEATNKDGSTTAPLPIGRVTLSIDLFKRG